MADINNSLGQSQNNFNLKVNEIGESLIENIYNIEFDGATVTDEGDNKVKVTIESSSDNNSPFVQETNGAIHRADVIDTNGGLNSTNLTDSASRAVGGYSHADSNGLVGLEGAYSHADSNGTVNYSYSHADSDGTANSQYSHANSKGWANGYNSHATTKGRADGYVSNANGDGSRSNSYSETAVGMYNEEIIANDSTAWNAEDLAFNIGIGENDSNRLTSFFAFKNGGFKFIARSLTNILNAAKGFFAYDENGRPNAHDGTQWNPLAYLSDIAGGGGTPPLQEVLDEGKTATFIDEQGTQINIDLGQYDEDNSETRIQFIQQRIFEDIQEYAALGMHLSGAHLNSYFYDLLNDIGLSAAIVAANGELFITKQNYSPLFTASQSFQIENDLTPSSNYEVVYKPNPKNVTGTYYLATTEDIPTLQEVLDNNHDLVDGNNFQGTGAGDGNTGTEVNAFGTDAGTDNTGNNQNAFGNSAGYENQGENQNALGESAGQENTGANQNAFGGSAGYQNIGDYQNAFGVGAGFLNTGANQNALGSSAGAYNTGNNQNAFGSSAGVDNTATNQNAFGSKAGQVNSGANQNALGENAGKNNSGISQNAFGNTAGQDNTGDNVNAFGENAGDGNTFSNVNLFGEGAQADEDGQTVLSKDGAIMARISTADLTETRKYTLPDADGTLALLDDIPPAITIDANPTDGSSNAVSSNGVFDALATKVSKSDYTPSHSILVQQSGTGNPTALQVGNNTLVGRVSGGGSDIDDLSTSQVRTMLSINNVDNTSDANKPVSTATQTALDLKQKTITSGTSAPSGGVDGDIYLQYT
jgi:hypothetical protein